jgi:XisH protein
LEEAMPARDAFHEVVKTALVKDGWTITHDPYSIQFGDWDLYADLGAERALAAEKDNEKIAVEVKSFLGPSEVHDFEVAVGQFVLCRHLMRKSDPEWVLFLAFPKHGLEQCRGARCNSSHRPSSTDG